MVAEQATRERHHPVEDHEIDAARTSVENSVDAVKAAEGDTSAGCCGAPHIANTAAILVSAEVGKLNLRINQSVLYKTQEIQDTLNAILGGKQNMLSYKGLTAKGMPAIILTIALVSGIGYTVFTYGLKQIGTLVESKIATAMQVKP